MVVSADMPISYDPMAGTFQQDMYTIYRALRGRPSLYRNPDGEWWAVARHADVQRVLIDWRSFSSRSPAVPHPEGHLAVQDPPRHTALRRLVSSVFTPRQLAELRPVVRSISQDLAASAKDGEPFDVVAQFAQGLPALVFAHMMGIPVRDVPAFQRMLADYVDTLARDPGDDLPRQRVHDALAALVAQRRSEPRHDLLTRLVQAEVDGVRLTEQEILGFCFNLVLAANETTTNLIANGVATLYAWPAALAALRDDARLIPDAVEEMLRYESPVQSLTRTVVQDVELAGTRIAAGAQLHVLYGCANRDETAFPDADRFDIRRAPGHHLAFGHGLHFCLGSHLARMEGAEALRALLPILGAYRAPEGPLQWKRSPWQRSLVHLTLLPADR